MGKVRQKWAMGPILAVLALGTLALCASIASAAVKPFEVEAYRQAFNLPLAVAEDGLKAQAKGTEADIVGDLEDRLDGDFAGVWFDNASSEFVIPVASDRRRAAIGEELTAARLAGEYHTRVVEHSWEELQAAQVQIDAELRELFKDGLVQTSLDPRTNAVVVHVSTAAKASDQAGLAQVVKRSRVPVELRESNADQIQAERNACSIIVPNCSPPLRGGVEIGPPGSEYGSCTAGFRAEGDTNGKRYVLTTGHCAALHNPPRIHWEARDEQKLPLLGEVHYLGEVEQFSFPEHDWMKINATGTWWDTDPWPAQVAYWQKELVTPPVNENYPIYGESSSYMNQTVCHAGIASGGSCGVVIAVDVSTVLGGTPSYDLTKVKNACAAAGDSGGPWFAMNMALGLHVGSGNALVTCPGAEEIKYSYYHEITEATDALGVTITPNIKPPAPGVITPEDNNLPGPHAIASPSGAVDTFYRTPSGTLGHTWTQGGSWSNETMPGPLHASSVPHPVTQVNGTVDVFWRTPSNGLGHAWDDATGWHVETLPGTLASEPHPVAQDDGTIDVFYKTPSGGLGHNWYQQGGQWLSNTLPGSVASDPYPVTQPSGAVDVFYRTPSGTLGHSWTQGGNWSQQPISGTSLAPSTEPRPVYGETVDVFWRKPDHTLGHAWVDGFGWHTDTLAGALTSDPHPVAQSDGVVDVFWRGFFSELGHNWYVPGSGWSANTLTSGLTSEPSAVALPSGTVDVFWRNANDGVGHAWYVDGGAWNINTLAGTTDPAAIPRPVAQPDGAIDVIYRTVGGGLGHNWYEAGGQWLSNTLPGSVAPPATTGKFNPSSKWTTWPTAYSVLFADVNADGREDIVGRNSSGDVQVGLSTGSGFASSTKWATWSIAYTFELADMNGDGKADAVGRNPSTGDRQVGLSTGAGFASPTSWGVWSAVNDFSFLPADVSGDGKADSVGRHFTHGEVRAGLSTGSGFSLSTKWATVDVAYTMEMADTNGDGKADLASRTYANGEVRVGLSTGSSFNVYHQGTWSNNYTLQFADVDGDNRADQVGRNGSTAEVWVGISTPGWFLSPVPWSTWPADYTVDFADVNGDGREDIVGRNSSGNVQVGISAVS